MNLKTAWMSGNYPVGLDREVAIKHLGESVMQLLIKGGCVKIEECTHEQWMADPASKAEFVNSLDIVNVGQVRYRLTVEALAP